VAKVKNVSGQDLMVPALDRFVFAGQEVEAPDEMVFGLTQQEIWEPVDKAAKSAHTAGENARDERVAAERDALSGVARLSAPPQDDEPVTEAPDDTEED
jgi:hypothetical protein